MPFPCGVKVKVNCSYGPRCSRAHKRTRSKFSTNDYYALDLSRKEKGNGHDKAVVAVADGIVRLAGWAKRGWAPYGKIVYIEHSFRDNRGRKYQSLYAHLNRVSVRPGQLVKAGDVIGTLGGSSRRRLRRYGSHLHFAVYRGAGSKLGGGRAVVPEPMGHHEDIRRGMVMEACGMPDRTIAFGSSPFSLETAKGGLE
jgi:hypothetical protein